MGRRAAPEEGNRGRGCPRAAAPPSRGAPAARGLGAVALKLATAAAPKDVGAESVPAAADAPASSGRKPKKGKGIPLFSTSSHRKY